MSLKFRQFIPGKPVRKQSSLQRAQWNQFAAIGYSMAIRGYLLCWRELLIRAGITDESIIWPIDNLLTISRRAEKSSALANQTFEESEVMSNAITIIAKTHRHADNFARAVYGTVTTVPIRHSVESAENGLRGARNRVIYLVDLDLSEISYLKRLHESRNVVFVVYWKEPVP